MSNVRPAGRRAAGFGNVAVALLAVVILSGAMAPPVGVQPLEPSHPLHPVSALEAISILRNSPSGPLANPKSQGTSAWSAGDPPAGPRLTFASCGRTRSGNT